MKILMLSTDRRIFEEGSAVRLRMARYGALADGLHIVVVTTRAPLGGAERIAKNVMVYATKSASKLLSFRDAIYLGRSIITNSKGGEWIISAQDPFETGFVGSRIARATGMKLQLQIHTDFLSPYFVRHSLKNRVRVLIARRLLPKADCIRVVSKRIKDSLGKLRIPKYQSEARYGAGKNYKFPPKADQPLAERTKILPIYTDKETFDGEKVFDLRKKYPQFTFIILMISRLEREKNVSLAIDVLKEVVKKYPRTGLVVVGDGREFRNLKRRAKISGVGGNVIFEGWQTELSSYYKGAHLYLLTSLYEGYGETLVEAALSGCPIVTTDVGIVGDVLKDEAHVLVCPVNDRGCLVKKITRVIEDKQLRSVMVQNAKAAIHEHLSYSWEEYLTRYRDGLTLCLKGDID